MGHLKFKLLLKGEGIEKYSKTVVEYNTFAALEDKYNFDLIERIDFDGDDLVITLELLEVEIIDWKIYNIPENVLNIILELQNYQDAKGQLKKVLERIRYTHFNERESLEKSGNQAVGILEKLKLSDHVNNVLIDNHIRAKAIRNTIDEEVKLVINLKDNAPQYKKRDFLEEAKVHLIREIEPIVNYLSEIKLNTET